MPYRDYRIHIGDAEVLSEKGVFPVAELAERQMICYSFYDSFQNWFYTFSQRADFKNEYFVDGNWTRLRLNSEPLFFNTIINCIVNTDPDLLTFWNAPFDWNYLVKRSMNIGAPFHLLSPTGGVNLIEKNMNRPPCGGRIIFDMLPTAKKLKPQPSDKLDEYARYLGVGGKSMSAEKIPEIWEEEEDPYEVEFYNYWDIVLVKRINDRLDVLPHFLGFKDIAGEPDLDNWDRFSELQDTLLLRLGRNRAVFRTRWNEEEFIKIMRERTGMQGTKASDWSYEGATVLKAPKPGVFYRIIILDFKRWYPSIMKALRLSTDCIDPDGEIHIQLEDLDFRTTKKHGVGWSNEMFEHGAIDRDQIEKELLELLQAGVSPDSEIYKVLNARRTSTKSFTTATWGYLSHYKSRLFCLEISMAIVTIARLGLNIVVDSSKEIGYPIIYGDTDSAFATHEKNVDFRDAAKEIIEHAGGKLNDWVKDTFGITEHEFVLECESYASKGFWTPIVGTKEERARQKGHALYIIYENGEFLKKPYILLKGIEAKRGDACLITRNLQIDTITRILEDKPRSEIIEPIKGIVNDIRNQTVPLIHICPGSNIKEEYNPIEQIFPSYYGQKKGGGSKTPPPVVRGAEYANKHLGTNFRQGSKAQLLWVTSMPKGYPTPSHPAVKKEEAPYPICFQDPSQVPPGTNIDIEAHIEKYVQRKVEKILTPAGIRWIEVDAPSMTMRDYLNS